MVEKFEDLIVWQNAHKLALEIYKLTKGFPAEERFGLLPQMRRAAVSIPANIAEGFKERGKRDKANFYNMAQASGEEVKYYLILSRDLGYAKDTTALEGLADEIGKMHHALIKSCLES